jgi:hypothetical protein
VQKRVVFGLDLTMIMRVNEVSLCLILRTGRGMKGIEKVIDKAPCALNRSIAVGKALIEVFGCVMVYQNGSQLVS